MDLVVTVPKDRWFGWIAEGDAVGDPPSGEEWGFFLGRNKPPIEPGDRLYIVAWGMLRGYAPVTRLQLFNDHADPPAWVICREAGAVACTVRGGKRFDGFRGFRHRWWEREEEVPFPEWRMEGLPKAEVDKAIKRGWLIERFVLRHKNGKYYVGLSGIGGPMYGELAEARRFDSMQRVVDEYAVHWSMGDCETETVFF